MLRRTADILVYSDGSVVCDSTGSADKRTTFVAIVVCSAVIPGVKKVLVA